MALTALTILRIASQPRCNAPHVPGLPLLGSALAIGRWGAAFLSACRTAFGPDAFYVNLGFGQGLLFVFHPALLEAFFKSPEEVVSFKPAVRRFTQRVYGLPAEEFGGEHEALLGRLRHLLVPAQLQRHAEGLLDTALPFLDEWPRNGKVELWEASKALVFQAAGRQLFGKPFFDRWGGEKLQHTFFVFEENFEIAASPVPHLFLPAFRAARSDLLRMLRASLAAGDFRGTPAGELLEGCGMRGALHPNALLAVLWASQANSVAAMFWSLGFMLLPENSRHLSGIREEVRAAAAEEAAAAAGGNGDRGAAMPGTAAAAAEAEAAARALRAAVVRLALDRRSRASRCVSEAIRLRVHSVAIRIVGQKEVVIPIPAKPGAAGGPGGCGGTELRARRGTVLAVCPFLSHHDSELYGGDGWSPWGFDPERAPVQMEAGTVAASTAGFGFGGGFWRCPGRFFAEMELALLLMAAVTRVDLRLPPPPPPPPAADGGTPGAALRALSSAACALLPRRRAEFGGVVLDGGVFEREEQRWRHSGDPQARLPACELRRLVGFKVPATGLLVDAVAVH